MTGQGHYLPLFFVEEGIISYTSSISYRPMAYLVFIPVGELLLRDLLSKVCVFRDFIFLFFFFLIYIT